MKEIAVFMSASETHNKKNVNKTIAETLAAFRDTVPPALSAGLRVRAYVSTVYGCPYEGEVDPGKAVELVPRAQASSGVTRCRWATRSASRTRARSATCWPACCGRSPRPRWRCTSTTRRARRSRTSWSRSRWGSRRSTPRSGGLGGCPYAPGASGNVATEDVVSMLDGMGVRTGIDLDRLVDCARLASTVVGHEVPSKYYRAAIGARTRAGVGLKYASGRRDTVEGCRPRRTTRQVWCCSSDVTGRRSSR